MALGPNAKFIKDTLIDRLQNLPMQRLWYMDDRLQGWDGLITEGWVTVKPSIQANTYEVRPTQKLLDAAFIDLEYTDLQNAWFGGAQYQENNPTASINEWVLANPYNWTK